MDTEFVNVNSYEIDPEGTIYVEKAFDTFTLEFEGDKINLSDSYDIVGLTIKQGDVEISLQNDHQLEYFKSVVKEIKDGHNQSRSTPEEKDSQERE